MPLRAWLRQPVSKGWLRLLLWPVGFVVLLLVLDYAPSLWNWLTSSEDLGARLRRECESVAREAHPEITNAYYRERYIRDCIDARARVVR